MADSTSNSFNAIGTTAQRTAFTPDPPTPASGPSNGYLWYDTDLGALFAWTGVAWVRAGGGGLTLISRATPSGTGRVTFSSIPTTYQDLVLAIEARSTAVASTDVLNAQLNNDTSANYNYQRVSGSISTASAANSTGQTSWAISTPAASATANLPSVWRLDIQNYHGTAFEKTAIGIDGTQFNLPIVSTRLWYWNSTSAISQIDVFYTTGNFVAGSVVSLYGLL